MSSLFLGDSELSNIAHLMLPSLVLTSCFCMLLGPSFYQMPIFLALASIGVCIFQCCVPCLGALLLSSLFVERVHLISLLHFHFFFLSSFLNLCPLSLSI